MIHAIVAILERFELDDVFLIVQEDCVISKPAEELMLRVVSSAFELHDSSIIDAIWGVVNSWCLVIGDDIQSFTHQACTIGMNQALVESSMVNFTVGDNVECT